MGYAWPVQAVTTGNGPSKTITYVPIWSYQDTGAAGADTLTGGAGSDTLAGGAGNDTLSDTGGGSNSFGGGVGDDPVFIAGMADWFEEVKPLYQSYWDVRAHDYNARMSDFQFPEASAMFRRRFGTPAVQTD